jgi:hypothetical protein
LRIRLGAICAAAVLSFSNTEFALRSHNVRAQLSIGSRLKTSPLFREKEKDHLKEGLLSKYKDDLKALDVLL